MFQNQPRNSISITKSVRSSYHYNPYISLSVLFSYGNWYSCPHMGDIKKSRNHLLHYYTLSIIFDLGGLSISFTFQVLIYFSQGSLQLLRIIFTLCMIKNYSVKKFELKALQFSQLAGDYCSIAFTFFHLLLNIVSIFSSKEVIHFYNLFCSTWITSNIPLRDYGSSFLTCGGSVQS